MCSDTGPGRMFPRELVRRRFPISFDVDPPAGLPLGPRLRAPAGVRTLASVSSPLRAPGAKLTLLVGLTMTFLGFVGVSRSLGALTTSPSAMVGTNADADVNEAAVALMEALVAAPLWRGLAVANLLVSALLVIASFLLTARARSAPWWAKQALWANAGFSVAAAAIHAYLIETHRGALMAALEAATQAQAAAQGVPPLGSETLEGLRWAAVAMITSVYLGMAALYVGLFLLTRREDVHRFVQREV